MKTQTDNRTGVDKLESASWEQGASPPPVLWNQYPMSGVFASKDALEVLKFILKEDEDSDKLQNQVSLERLHDLHTHFLVLNNLGLLLPDKLN